jgi:hypothetical protein
MHIPGTMVKIEKLSGLGHGTKQRIVTPGAFLDLIETYGGTLCMPFGGLDGTIKIQCQAGQAFALESLNYD